MKDIEAVWWNSAHSVFLSKFCGKRDLPTFIVINKCRSLTFFGDCMELSNLFRFCCLASLNSIGFSFFNEDHALYWSFFPLISVPIMSFDSKFFQWQISFWCGPARESRRYRFLVIAQFCIQCAATCERHKDKKIVSTVFFCQASHVGGQYIQRPNSDPRERKCELGTILF